MKAIDTNYKGHLFRSRLEARWAVFFDVLGVQWEYEKEGYDLGDDVYYLPDFWLPAQQCFIEIKPEFPIFTEMIKAALLADQSQHWVDIVYGQPTNYKICGFRGPTNGIHGFRGKNFYFALCDDCNTLTIARHYPFYDGSYISGYMGEPYYMSHCYACNGHALGTTNEYIQKHTCLLQALTRAQKARFEYGSNGNEH